MKLQQSISKRAKQQWVGRELVVLAEGESEETPLLWEGRTQFHAPEIDGKVYINDFGDSRIPLEPGRFYKAPKSPKPTTTTSSPACLFPNAHTEIPILRGPIGIHDLGVVAMPDNEGVVYRRAFG
jgi:hypothetical protein